MGAAAFLNWLFPKNKLHAEGAGPIPKLLPQRSLRTQREMPEISFKH